MDPLRNNVFGEFLSKIALAYDPMKMQGRVLICGRAHYNLMMAKVLEYQICTDIVRKRYKLLRLPLPWLL